MFTSCCPAWVRFLEKNYPEMLPHLSSCKSPHQMFGAVLKSYYAKKNNIDPKKIKVISVMPCVAKKYESTREEMEEDTNRDVDVVITTRELARLIKQNDIDFLNLEDSEFENPMGEASRCSCNIWCNRWSYGGSFKNSCRPNRRKRFKRNK